MGTELKFMAWASEWMATQPKALVSMVVKSPSGPYRETHQKTFNINTALILNHITFCKAT